MLEYIPFFDLDDGAEVPIRKIKEILFYSRIFGLVESAFRLILRLLFSNAGRDGMAGIAYAVILMNGGRYRSSITMRAGRVNLTESFLTIDEGNCYGRWASSRVNLVNGAGFHHIDEQRSRESLSRSFVNFGRHFGLKVLESTMFKCSLVCIVTS
jgi:hypothetical protein